MLDYVVIGAGPAGLQLGFFLEKAGRDYVVLERNAQAGSFFQKYPRSRRLISYNRPPVPSEDPKVQMRFDWNSLLSNCDPSAPKFRDFDKDFLPKADSFTSYLNEYSKRFQLNIKYNTNIVKVTKKDDVFLVVDEGGEHYETKCLIMASGAAPYIPEIKGVEHVTDDYSTVSMEPEEFEGQRVLIIGKGNSAFEVLNVVQNRAMVSIMVSPESLQLAWETKHSGHARSTLIAPLDAYQLKTINGILIDADISEIRHNGKELEVDIIFSHAQSSLETLLFDRIITCTGFRFDTSIFSSETQPDLVIDDRFPALTNSWESTNVEGLFFAGTLTQAIDYQKAASTFIGGYRHNAQTLFNLLEEKYHDVTLPYEVLDQEAKDIARHIANRLTRSASIFFQFDLLADILVYENGELRYYESLVIDYAIERFKSSDLIITVSFIWGSPDNNNVLSFNRVPTKEAAAESVFIHPIIRSYSQGKLYDQQHILDDLFGCYMPGAFDQCFTKSRSMTDLAQWHEHYQVDAIREVLEGSIATISCT
ncbi:NAD(P)-binding domain-containing protein [Flexibacterium corallicola]|uniref:NAD(P)-binding domain-containing protein n=1 Tax=Flexibacterium corallicola TaxID=3037259 RepID=UPI00286EE47A|nr:NAD(P)-binding domain-containing protein [Pseudovibrio sp. M1P-2-3]